MKSFDLFDLVGEMALFVVCLSFFAAVAVLVLVLWAVETLQSARWLGPLICGAAIAYALVTAAG